MTFRPRRRPPDQIDWLDNEGGDDEEDESVCGAPGVALLKVFSFYF